jgi:hypothetical protein
MAVLKRCPGAEPPAARGFLEAEVVPQATRAADQGIDPTPLFDVVAGVLRLYADALERPETAGAAYLSGT